MIKISVRLFILILGISLFAAPLWAAPQISFLNPASVGAGAASKNVAVYGSGFQCGVSVTFSNPAITTANDTPLTQFSNPCAGGTVKSNVQYFSSSNIYFNVNVPSSISPAGPVPVAFTLTNPDNSSVAGTLTMNPAPRINSITACPCPQPVSATTSSSTFTVLQGGTLSFQINGSGLQNGAVLTGAFTANSFNVDGTGTFGIANLTVSPNAYPSLTDVTIVNPDGGVATQSAVFLVQLLLGSKTPAILLNEYSQIGSGINTPFASFWNRAWSAEGHVIPAPYGFTPSDISLRPHPFLFQQIMGHQIYPGIEFQVWSQGTWGHPFVTSGVASASGAKNFDLAYESQSGNGLIVYGTTTGLFYRQFFQVSAVTPACDAGVSGNSSLPPCWGPENSITTAIGFTSSFPNRVALLANPDSAKNEIFLAYQDNSSCLPACGKLYLQVWNGNSFSGEQRVSSSTRIDTVPFDLAYMQSSKKAMLAWLEFNNGIPRYCIWNGTSCPAQSAAQAGPLASTDLFRIRLSADPSSDQIAMGTLRDTQPAFLTTQIWSGTTWPSGSYSSTNLKGVYTDSSQLVYINPYTDWNDFSLVWKKNSSGGILFAIYNNVAGGLNYQTWFSATGWDGDKVVPGIVPDSTLLTPAVPTFVSVDFDSDPRSGDLLGVMRAGNSLLSSIRWDGNISGWTDYQALVPGNSNFLVVPFAVSYFRDFPTLSSLQISDLSGNPVSPQQGSSIKLSLTGSLIQQGAVLSFPGFTQAGVSSVNPGGSQMTASGAIDPNVLPGMYDLTLTNPDRSLAIGMGWVTVSPGSATPHIFSIMNRSIPSGATVNPNSAGQGAVNQTLVATGYNLTGAASYTLSFMINGTVDPNIVITTPQPLTPSIVPSTGGQQQQLSIQVNVLPGALAGPRNIQVTSGGQSYTFQNLFYINYAPSIINVTPGTITQGSTQTNLLVQGNDFQTKGRIIIANLASSLGWNSPGGSSTGLYQNKMTGNNFYIPAPSTTTTTVILYQVLFQINLLDPINAQGQVAVYDDLKPNGTSGNGAPGNLIAVSPVQALTSPNTGLQGLQVVTFGLVNPINITVPARYWVLVNVDGFQTLLTYDSNISSCNGDTSCIGVVSPQLFGSVPGPRGDTSNSWTKTAGKKYGAALLYWWSGRSWQVGNPVGAISDGPDSNQITATQFSVSAGVSSTAYVNGAGFYVNTLDPNKQSGSVGIYDNYVDPTTGKNFPGNLIVSSGSQQLFSQSFNTLSFPVTTLSPGTYWLSVNVDGPGTTLTYDDGTTANSAKLGDPFGVWPSFIGSSTLNLTGRRYSIAALQDVSVSNNNVFSSTLIGGTVSADLASTLGPRQICVINPDGGQGCFTSVQIIGKSIAQRALTAYGTTLLNSPAYRIWRGYAPWDVELMSPPASGGPPLWSVVRTYPHLDSRSGEKILGTIGSTFTSPSALTLQVWNNTTSSWMATSAISLTTSPTFSRSFDIAYESNRGNGMVVYGVPGNPVPQSLLWNGAGWVSQPVGATNITGNTVLSIRLEPNPNPASNEIILAYLSGDVTVDAQGNTTVGFNIALHTLVWNGASFIQEQVIPFPTPLNTTSNINLCGNCTPPFIGQLFDLAYEHLTNRAILAWGYTGNSTPGYMIWNDPKSSPLQWSIPFQANRAAGDTGTSLIYFKLSGDPNSDKIAMGTGTVNGQYDIQLWNGSAWGTPAARVQSAPPGPGFSTSGEWSQTAVVSPPASSGNQWISSLMSDSATLTFTGSEMNIIGQKNSFLGIGEIYIDGVLKGEADFYYPVPTERMVLFSASNLSANATHTLKVEPSGLFNPNSFIPQGALTESNVANTIFGSQFTAKKDGNLVRLDVFLNSVDPGYINSFGLCGVSTGGAVPEYSIALYSDIGGNPGQLLGPPLISCTPQTGAWNGVFYPINPPPPVSVPVTAGTQYWILVNVKDPGTAVAYASASSASKSVKLGSQSFGTGDNIWPTSFSSTTPWSVSTGKFYSLYGVSQTAAQVGTFLEQVDLGVGPPVIVDSFDVANATDSPTVASTNLLYYASPPFPALPDPTSIGRNFDLAWEKDSGRIITVYGSSNSINICRATNFNTFPYSTRFKRWDSGTGWSTDVLVPLTGADLVPRWIQISPDTVSNDLFLGISGQSTILPYSPGCSLGNLNFHQYAWHHEAWTDKEVLNTSLGGAFVPSASHPGNGATGFTESFMTVFDSDNSPPSQVSDLIVTSVTPNSATLQWTAPGDDFSQVDQVSLGKVAKYTLAWSNGSTINTTTVMPTRFAGGIETFTLAGQLAPATSYTFSLTSVDKAGNVSLISTNNPTITTPSAGTGQTGVALAPLPIQDLKVDLTSLSNNSVQLTWTAPLISSTYSGTGAAYDLRYCNIHDNCIFPIVDNTSFNAAHSVIATDGTGRNGLSPPHQAGTKEFFSFTNLPPDQTSFAIKTCGPAALDPVTFRCTGNPQLVQFISSINTPLPVSINNSSLANQAPPSAISDLSVTGASSNSIILRWTAPGNNGQIGTASQYDFRVSTTPITTSSFSVARQISPVPVPLSSGMVQSFAVTNLLSNTTTGITYYFAVETINSSGVRSQISNVVSGVTKPVFDFIPPAPITDLSVVKTGINKNSIMISWTATGDDGNIGTAMAYDIRYSLFPIVDDFSFQRARQVDNPPAPLPSGNKEFYTVGGLDSNTLYYFSIKAIDKGSNSSLVSTCLNCPGHTALFSGYNLVSVPYRLTGLNDPASVFGNDVSRPVTLYQWMNGAYSIPSLIMEGAGYFLYAQGSNSVLKASDPSGNLLGVAETGVSAAISLQNGWNMIGNPYLHPVFLKDTCVKSGDGPSVPFGDAVANGWVGNSIYSYNGTQYVPEIYLDPLGINLPAEINSWNGYWLQLYASGTYSLIYLNSPGACP